MSELTNEQKEILNHTMFRAANGMYCGNSDAMRDLVSRGMMYLAGKPTWCPDEYFGITKSGRAAVDGEAYAE